jgi:hypothetical protein
MIAEGREIGRLPTPLPRFRLRFLNPLDVQYADER